MAVNRLPVEIVRAIIRQATMVPGALDTSYESTFEPDMDIEQEKELILRSFTTKRSLSLVSKTFHVLTEEYLYEILCLTSWETVQPLVELLRERANHRLAPGGWTRRLDIVFGKGMDVGESGEDRMPTLWGLLPACPNLTILHYDPTPPPVVRSQAGWCCVIRRRKWIDLMSEELLRTIAALHDRTLRKLVLGRNVSFQRAHLARFLVSMVALEFLWTHSPGMDNRLPFMPSEWTEAPPTEHRLTRLHTCRVPLVGLPLENYDWSLKNLQHLSLVGLPGGGVIRNELPPKFLDQISESMTSLCCEPCFEGSEESNPDALVRLLDKLPNLKHLLLQDSSLSWNSHLPSIPHKNLCTITVYRRSWAFWDWQNRQSASLVANLEELTEILEEGRLPAMRHLRILGNGELYTEFLKPRRLRWLKNCGITVDIRDKADEFC